MTFYLAMRNLYMRKRRYSLMGIAVLLGFTLVTVLSGIAFGTLETVKTKAARYFSGHVSITGYHGGKVIITDPDSVIERVRNSGFPVRTVARRSIYYGKEAKLFFGGKTIVQRRPIGIDFESELPELSTFSFTEGSLEGMLGSEGHNGILISRTAAEILGARVGDDVILYMATGEGQHNTATMIVRGIFNETSIFGYASYLRIEDLNYLYNRPSDSVTDIAVYLDEGISSGRIAEKIRVMLGNSFPVFPRLGDRDALGRERAKLPEKETLAVMSLDAQLAQINDIMDAFLAGTYFILAVFMLIVMIGILNTYRVLVHERTKEVGTMRAIGMQKNQVRIIFLSEAAALAVFSSAAGLILGILILKALGSIDLSDFTAAGLFTENGKLGTFVYWKTVFLNLILMTASVVIAAWGPTSKAASLPPAHALGKNG